MCIGKRVTKSSKIYFYDTGLACSLLGIESSAQIDTHYLRSELFESFIINEIDCIIEKATELIAVEIKARKTIVNSGQVGRRSAGKNYQICLKNSLAN